MNPKNMNPSLRILAQKNWIGAQNKLDGNPKIILVQPKIIWAPILCHSPGGLAVGGGPKAISIVWGPRRPTGHTLLPTHLPKMIIW